jgi:glycopeptide antibiotics resistance protein
MRWSAAAGLAALGYLAFVVYGSLVPWDFQPLPLDVARQRFQAIPMLELGVGSRADWVANGVLYVPLGFLFARALGFLGAPLAWLLAVLLCVAVATGVEFAQLFFPPRTVSQNDLLAEFIGSALGASLALVLGPWVARLHEAWAERGRQLGQHLLDVYAVLYVALVFFPYDLLLSGHEVATKFESSSWSFGLVVQERGVALSLLQLVVEIALVMPIGVLLARRWRSTPAQAAAVGLLLGAAIEIGQFFIASGISQGASVLTRAGGLALGAWLAPALAAGGLAGLRAWLRRWSWPLLCAYLPLLLYASGWFRGAWQGLDSAAATWVGVRLLPFYYHYYTSEAVALFSLGSVALMYLPAAALGWARGLRTGVVLVAVLALALVVETGKLFFAGQRPDPTNLIIAVATAALALRLAGLADRQPASADLTGPRPMSAGPAGQRPASVDTAAAAAAALRDGPGRGSHGNATWPLLLVLPAAAAWAWAFPAFSWLLLAMLAACAALVWWRPVLALAVVPAALPVLDLAPWSGRFFWTEFDLLLAVCLAVATFRTRPPAAAPAAPPQPAVTLAFGLLGLSLLASTVRALWPWPGIDDNSFSSYHSAFNALRIVKGALWAWLFVVVHQRLAAQGDNRARLFGSGMVLGLAATVAWVLWERVTFVGLLDFAADYRVTGPISAMHRGGAFIECFLAVASAFALAGVVSARSLAWRVLALVVLLGAGYAVMVTYSRNGYAAFAAVLVLGVALQLSEIFRARGRPASVLGPGLAAAVVVLLVVAVALPVLGGSFARERLAQTSRDLAVRQAHWADALQLRQDGPATLMFGEGLGRFPQAHYWRSQEPQRAGSYALLREGGRRFLRLGGGATLYVEQVLPRDPGGVWTLSLDLRSPQPQAALAVALCHKSTLTSLRCVHGAAGGEGPPGAWRRAELRLDTTELQASAHRAGPLLKLALLTPGDGPALDVGRLSLKDESGAELLANADFSAGMDRWFFATDVDPPWHIHSLPLAIWFDQGAFGALAWSLVLFSCGIAAWRLWRERRAALPAAAVAVAAFLVSGSLNTLIDEPRFLMLLLVCLWLATAAAAPARPARSAAEPEARASGPPASAAP